ncbi:hypothetical protein [Enterobacter asburiae]|uniref:hypothetical protein n=1 Tax=Enterobacter asburiae TaxID=61645 RepID=UPI0021D10DF1|nr:hypothetical protein [Enterobacter asburiae]MCU6243861.1 hypothetical protein [Enterobacter asburiae]
MTNNLITAIPATDEEIQDILNAFEYDIGLDDHDIIVIRRAFSELQERREAAMDSEPVAYWRKAFRADGFCYADGINSKRYHNENPPLPLGNGDYWDVIPLYRHAQPAQIAPETIPDALRDEIIDLCAGYEIGDQGAQEIWEACRAVMLNGGKP